MDLRSSTGREYVLFEPKVGLSGAAGREKRRGQTHWQLHESAHPIVNACSAGKITCSGQKQVQE